MRCSPADWIFCKQKQFFGASNMEISMLKTSLFPSQWIFPWHMVKCQVTALEWARKKNWKGQSGHRNISSLKIFATAAAFFHSLQYLTNYLQRSRIGKYLCYENSSIVLLKSGRRKIIVRYRVGRESSCPRAEWAAKIFLVKCYFPAAPLVVNNDRALTFCQTECSCRLDWI